MTTTAAPSLARQKRRQALQVFVFLAALTAATLVTFHWARSEVVAYRRGEQALSRGEWKSAAAQLGEAWAGGYRTPRSRLELARARLETGQRDDALALYEEALAAAPRDENLLDTIAGVYQAKGDPRRGLALYTDLGSKDGLSTRSLLRLGDLQQQAGRYEEAAATYRLAAQRSPGDAEIQLRLGIILGWLGRHREALSALDAALAIAPDHRLAQLYRARTLLWDGRFADAVAGYRRVLGP